MTRRYLRNSLILQRPALSGGQEAGKVLPCTRWLAAQRTLLAQPKPNSPPTFNYAAQLLRGPPSPFSSFPASPQ